MILTTKDGREVEIKATMYAFDDIQITDASFVDSDEYVPDEIVEELEERYADRIWQHAYENAIGAAEYYYEGDR